MFVAWRNVCLAQGGGAGWPHDTVVQLAAAPPPSCGWQLGTAPFIEHQEQFALLASHARQVVVAAHGALLGGMAALLRGSANSSSSGSSGSGGIAVRMRAAAPRPSHLLRCLLRRLLWVRGRLRQNPRGPPG